MQKFIKKFKKEFRNDFNFSNIKHFLEEKGYTVILYDRDNLPDAIKKFHKENVALTKNGFIVAGGNLAYIFINRDLKENDRIIAVLHEYFHRIGGHLSKEVKSETTQECEAYAFAYSIINYKELFGFKRKSSNIVSLILCVALCCVCLWKIPYSANTNKPLSTSAVSITSEDIMSDDSLSQITVYITKSGTKFHKSDCRYVKNKNNINELAIPEALEHYTPCKVCNPLSK